MEFSWITAWVTIMFWLVQVVLSLYEGTFCRQQLLDGRAPVNFHGRYRWQHLPMSFLNNWSVSIGDLFVFPIVNGLVVPCLWSKRNRL